MAATAPIRDPIRLNTLFISLNVTVPLLLDLAFHEGYLRPSTHPNLYTNTNTNTNTTTTTTIPPTLKTRLNLTSGFAFGVPPELTFRRYHTENRLHAQYIYAKKSFWRYNFLWSMFGVIATGLQVHHLVRSIRNSRPGGVVAAVGAMGLLWGVSLVEGRARWLYLLANHEDVLKEEREAF